MYDIGPYQSWYENCQKWTEYNFHNGELHGIFQEWHENGLKHIESNYQNGQIHGPYQSWDSNGQKHEELGRYSYWLKYIGPR